MPEYEDLYHIHPAEDPDTSEQRANEPQVPPQTGQAVEGVCAFLMVQGVDGRWVAYFNVDQIGPLSVQRPAHRYDALGGFEAVKVDIVAGINAETALQAQMRVAQQVAQQQQAQELMERLNLGPNGRPKR